MTLCEPKTRRDQRREAILDVARAVFSQEGYAAASMSTIAARLGGSKGTLYNYFKNKAELFEAFVRDYCEQHAEYVFGVPLEGGNVEEVLTGVGERFLHLVLSDQATCFYRLIAAEAHHNPAIGRVLYDSGYRIAIERLAEYLDHARADGLIAAEDCKRAADDFLTLCQGLQWKRVLNVARDLSGADIRAEAARIAQTFVRAYGTRSV